MRVRVTEWATKKWPAFRFARVLATVLISVNTEINRVARTRVKRKAGYFFVAISVQPNDRNSLTFALIKP